MTTKDIRPLRKSAPAGLLLVLVILLPRPCHAWDVCCYHDLTVPAPLSITVSTFPPASTTCLPPVAPSLYAPVQSQFFPGPDDATNYSKTFSTAQPADPAMAVSATHVVSAVNGVVTISDRAGFCFYQVAFKTWFQNQCGTGCVANASDPNVRYDPLDGHWLLSVDYVDQPGATNYVMLSVSATSDPTAQWYTYMIPTVIPFGGNTFADQPMIGFDNVATSSGGAIYLTSTQFFFNGSPQPGAQTSQLSILPKSSLYAGSGFHCWQAWNPINSNSDRVYFLRPASKFGTTDSNNPIEYLFDTWFDAAVTPASIDVWTVVPTYPPTVPNWQLRPGGGTVVGTYMLPVDAGQPSSCNGTLIDVPDTRLKDVVWSNNIAYSTFVKQKTITFVNDAVQYFGINSSTSYSLALNKVYSQDGAFFFSPSIAPDASGNVAIVYAESSSTDYPSLWYTGQKTTETLPEPGAELAAGTVCAFPATGLETTARWGDYFTSVPDEGDTSRVWVFGAYAESVGDRGGATNWGTKMADVGFVADYSITASPGAVSGQQGTTPTTTVTSSSLNNFAGSVALSCSGLPAGITCSFSPPSVTLTAGGSVPSTLSIIIGASVPRATYNFLVNGDSGAFRRAFEMSVQVLVPGYSITVTPTLASGAPGGSATTTVTLTSIDGYANPVTLSVTGLPVGVTATFSVPSPTPTPAGATSLLILAIAGTVSPGLYNLQVTGTGASPRTIQHSVPLSLEVNGVALKFYTITPCRLIDTRRPVGTYGGPAFQNATTRAFPVNGQCGVPTTALAISMNVTAIVPGSKGDFRVFSTGIPVPPISSINFNASLSRANNAIISMTGSPTGSITIQCDMGTLSTNMLLDINGYFAP